ncbi:homoserine dehydrogenase [Halobacillus salinarum]|uniref:Homoserine dehydrogenase n=1 Tax=Halobacillus salinarum TaxID=2932257 RepID=A0ABY4EMY7_9BACI|nr:homoserine dehydrogenase [Halobacillus salinarum]UOQ45213.1 homoserine dehydrogenase [Halobacillus salinarum]
MTVVKVALLGFGTVGQGVFEILENNKETLQKQIGAEVHMTSILVKNIDKQRNLPSSLRVTDRMEEVLQQNPDVIFEAINGEEPARKYINRALEKGVSIITANKEMFAKHGRSLLNTAEKNGTAIGYEATTASGTPIIGMISKLLQMNRITKVEAILNGTSNYILTHIQEEGMSFENALSLAQSKGFAEVDPSSDLKGIDAFYKLMILSELIYGTQPKWDQVSCDGISHLTSNDFKTAGRSGKRIKLLASLEQHNNQIIARVEPKALDSNHPLFSVNGVDNAIMVDGEFTGPLTLRGPGAGKLPTASAMVEDFITAMQTRPLLQTISI